MKKISIYLSSFLLGFLINNNFAQSREVAITIDDLPVASGIKDNDFQQKLTTELLSKT